MSPSALDREAYSKVLRKHSTASLQARYTSVRSKMPDDIASYYEPSPADFSRVELIGALVDMKAMLDAIDEGTDSVVLSPVNGEVESLIEELGRHTIRLETGIFPVTLGDDDLFTFANGVTLDIHEVGAGYLSERFPHVPYKVWTSYKRHGNAALLSLITSTVPNGEKYKMMVLDGQVLSFMSNYVPYYHDDLLASLEEERHLWRLVNWKFDTYALSLYFATHVVESYDIGLLIVNGHSGHVAMSFKLFIRNAKSGWETKLSPSDFYPEGTVTRRRHLVNIDEVKEGMREAFANISALALDGIFSEPATRLTDIILALPHMTTRQSNLLNDIMLRVESEEIKTVGDVLNAITPFYNTRGYAATVSGLIDDPLKQLISVWRLKGV
jgi:hypothetical protein